MNGDFDSAQYRSDLDWDLVFLEEQFDTAELKRREIWRLFEDDYRNKLIVFIGVSFKDPALRRILSVTAQSNSSNSLPASAADEGARRSFGTN